MAPAVPPPRPRAEALQSAGHTWATPPRPQRHRGADVTEAFRTATASAQIHNRDEHNLGRAAEIRSLRGKAVVWATLWNVSETKKSSRNAGEKYGTSIIVLKKTWHDYPATSPPRSRTYNY